MTCGSRCRFFGGKGFEVAKEIVFFLGSRRLWCSCNRDGFFVARQFEILEEVVRQFVRGVRFAVVVFVTVFGQAGEFIVEVVQFGELRVEAVQSVQVSAGRRGVAHFDFAHFVANFLAFVRVHFRSKAVNGVLREFFHVVFVVAALALGEHEGSGATEGENAGACGSKQRQRQAAGDFVFGFFLRDGDDRSRFHFRHGSRCGAFGRRVVGGNFHRNRCVSFCRLFVRDGFGLYGNDFRRLFGRGVVGGDLRRVVSSKFNRRFCGGRFRLVGREGIGAIQRQRVAIQRRVFCASARRFRRGAVVLCEFHHRCGGRFVVCFFLRGFVGFGFGVLCHFGSGCRSSSFGCGFCRFFGFFRLGFGLGAVGGDFRRHGFARRQGSSRRIGDDQRAANHQVAHVVMRKRATVGVVDGAHHLLDRNGIGRTRGVGNGEQGFVRFDRAVFAADRNAARFDRGGVVGVTAFAVVVACSRGRARLFLLQGEIVSTPAFAVGACRAQRGLCFARRDLLFFGLVFFGFFFLLFFFFRVGQHRLATAGSGQFGTRFGLAYRQQFALGFFRFVFFAFFLAFAVAVRKRRFFDDCHWLGRVGV